MKKANIVHVPQIKVARIWRADPLRNWHVWILSDLQNSAIPGLWLHFVGKPGRGIYCPGERGCANHKVIPQWRGYLAIQKWVEPDGPWEPWVMEVTPQLELDMRGKVRRGQIWLVGFHARSGQVKKSVNGKLIDQREGDSVPPEFDVIPTLQSVHYPFDVKLNVPNGLAPRCEVFTSNAPGPHAAPNNPASLPPDQIRQRLQASLDHAAKNGRASDNQLTY